MATTRVTVCRWTGREATALRAALRLSLRGFAARLGVGARTVSRWEELQQDTVPLPEIQAVLDTALAQASEDAQARFSLILQASADGEPSTPQALEDHPETRQEDADIERPAPPLTPDLSGGPPPLVVTLLTQLARLLQQGGVSVSPQQRDHALQRLVDLAHDWIGNMDRREILQLLGSATSALIAWPLLADLNTDEQQRVARTITSPTRVDDKVISHIESVYWSCRQQDDALGPQAVLNTVTAQEQLVRTLLPECPSGLRPRLLSIYSALSASVGWLYFDLNDLAAAVRYYEQARVIAHEAENAEHAALVLCQLSHTAAWSGHTRLSIDHAVAARTWAQRCDDVRLHALAADRIAISYAMQGQYRNCMEELDSIQEVIPAAATQRESGSLAYFYDDGFFASTRSECLLLLNKPALAVAAAHEALAQHPQSFVRNNAFSALFLTRAFIQSNEIDQAASVMGDAADLVAKNRSSRLLNELHAARTSMQPWQDLKAVKELDELLVAHCLT